MKYLVKTGLTYRPRSGADEKDVAPGEVVDDLPRSAIKNLLAEGAVEKISDAQAKAYAQSAKVAPPKTGPMPPRTKAERKTRRSRKARANVAVDARHHPVPDREVNPRRTRGTPHPELEDVKGLTDDQRAAAENLAAHGENVIDEAGDAIQPEAEVIAEEAGVVTDEAGGPTTQDALPEDQPERDPDSGPAPFDPDEEDGRGPVVSEPAPFDPDQESGHGDGLEGSEA